jgi:protein-S-isoprenylcysteine O-methyltransferase Ste14
MVSSSESVNKYGMSSIVREFVIVIFIAILLWVSAGFQLWLNAWLYIIFLLFFSTIFMIAMAWKNPRLLNIRGAPRQAIQQTQLPRYEKIFLTVFTLLLILIPIFAGLDYQGLFDLLLPLPILVPLWLVGIGFGLVVIGESLFGWAMVANPFFHGMMAIQTERSHHVISKGPYRLVRHPGYLGQILYYLGTPLLLASWWAFFLVIIMTIAFIYRTKKEDLALMAGLPGYSAYSEKTRRLEGAFFRGFGDFWHPRFYGGENTERGRNFLSGYLNYG